MAIAIVALLAIVPLIVVFDSEDQIARVDPSMHAGEELAHMSLLAKAQAGMNLTPWERSLLKLGESLLVAFGVAAAPVVADALSTHSSVDWNATIHNAVLLGVMAIALTLVKYFKAQGDNPLAQFAATELQGVADHLSAANGLNEATIEAALPENDPEPPTDAPQAAALAEAA